MTKRKARWLVEVGLVTLSMVATSHAFAHAAVASSDPAANTTMTSSPPQVSITFTEALEATFSSIQFVDDAGQAMTREKATVDPARPAVMHLVLPTLKPGRYQVQWTSVARDGHRMKGSYSFVVK